MKLDGITYGAQPRSFGPRFGAGLPRVIVMHKTDNPNSNANGEAHYATWRPDGVSAHFYTDPYRIVGSVELEWQAHGSHSKGNAAGYQIEECGLTGQGHLLSTVRIVARLCRRDNIPMRRLTPAMLAQGEHGIVGHHDCVVAFGQGNHTDPGWSDAQWRAFINAVKADIGGPVGQQITSAHVQQALIDAGFNVGPTGADDDWGRNSQAGLTAAFKAAREAGRGLPEQFAFSGIGTLKPVPPADTPKV